MTDETQGSYDRYRRTQDLYQRIDVEWTALAERLGFADWRDMLMSLTPDVQRIVDVLEARSRAWLQRNGAPEGPDFEYRSYQGHQNKGFWNWYIYTHDCAHDVNNLIMRTVAARRWNVDARLVKATSKLDRATAIPLDRPGSRIPVSRTAHLADPRPAGDLATTWFYTEPHTPFHAKLEYNLQHHVMKALAEPGAYPRAARPSGVSAPSASPLTEPLATGSGPG